MDIDVSKENIQPLRGGRNLAQLGAALHAQADQDAQRQLLLQKEELEAAIHNYQGSDPLDPWFNYIQWVEQSFPKHGHEGHIDNIIKDCLQLFEKEEHYFQDRRFVKLWIKYIDCLTNPLEIYQRLYNSGIGVECSEFYRAWACYCEESGDYKKANQVYMLGIQARAQPIDELEHAHMNFQLFFAQRMLHDDSPTKRKAASALAETRMALTSLKSFKRRNIANVPVQRIGDNVRSVVPGIVRQQPGAEHRGPASNIMVNVYEDVPSTSGGQVPVVENPGPASLVQACANMENEKEVGVWTNAKTKMVHTNVVPHNPLSFTPYEDEEDMLKLPTNHMSYCVDDLIFNVPLCVPDPPDSTKISCYDKTQVYVDNTEFSLEEIRSRKFELKKNFKTEEITKEIERNESIQEPVQQLSALETLANCALDTEQDHLGQLMPLTIPTLQNITKVQSIHSPGEPKVLVNLDSKEFSELANPVRRNDENQCHQYGGKQSNSELPAQSHPFSTEHAGPSNYEKNNFRDDFDRSLMGNFLGDSVTVNTKEARWELRNLFNDNEPSIVQPVVQQFEIPNFDIHEDRSITMALHTKKKKVLQEVAASSAPEDKENANKFSVPTPITTQNISKTAYYEEPSCTQVFNFNIKSASTPNMSQFKRPTSYIDQSNKISSVPKFNIDDSMIEGAEVPSTKKEDASRSEARLDQQPTGDAQGTALSVIMEATREYNSKSGSSSSGHQSTRTNFTGYTTTPYSEGTQASNYDSMYQQQTEIGVKRTSMSSQSRLANAQFSRMQYPQKPTADNKLPVPAPSVPYLSHDHQYQKPVSQPYNGYAAQRAMPPHGYQQNYNGSYQPGYGGQLVNQQAAAQQGYASPNHNYQSPQHPGVQSPHHISSPVHPGFQSPPLHYPQQHKGYSNMPHVQNSPVPNYPNAMRHEYQQMQPDYANQVDRQQAYVNQSRQQATYQSPPHQNQYANSQYYQRVGVASSPNIGYAQQPYTGMQHNQYNAYGNNNVHPAQNYNQQSPYRQPPNNAYNASYQIYQSPHNPQADYQSSLVQKPMQEKYEPMQTSPDVSKVQLHINSKQRDFAMSQSDAGREHQNVKNTSVQENPVSHRSPTAALRSVRHDQTNIKGGQSDVGFSNQFLHFISARNEPKDNANTPKFSNSPNISHKMQKNLYVSSPEQAQVPPSGHSDSESKDGMTAQTVTAIQTAKVTPDKNKNLSKRQLEFEHRMDLHSEDSRDSISKESRISSVYSRQSDFQSDGYGMDVDSENSMECGTFKSMHSISLVDTCDIARPADIKFPEIIDPFNKKILTSLLEYVKFPNKTHAEGYNEVRSVPKLQVATLVTVGNNRFSIEKQLGKGNYGAVFLCLDVNTNRSVAVKYQKPSRPWEFYICQEIKARIKDPFMLPGYMDITTAFLGDNASLFVSEYSKYGSLLDIANKVKIATSKCINEFIVFLLTSEMLSIVHYLHKAQIIHADIKPDNFLLMKIPAQEWRTPSLQLIDLGCAIDMSLFPEDTTFRELISTEGFTCTEMREGKPWTYQTDLYCLAGTIHVILFGSYMKVINRLGQWNIDRKLPRYMKASLWDKIFTTLLNVPDCNNLPDLLDLKSEVDSLINRLDNLRSELRNLANILKSR